MFCDPLTIDVNGFFNVFQNFDDKMVNDGLENPMQQNYVNSTHVKTGILNISININYDWQFRLH